MLLFDPQVEEVLPSGDSQLGIRLMLFDFRINTRRGEDRRFPPPVSRLLVLYGAGNRIHPLK